MKGFKGFNKGLVCREYQFKEGETFEQEGRLGVCGNGFHFCENPFDVLEYYPLVGDDGNITEFAEVEALGEVKTEGNKSATNKIRIGAKLGLPGFIQASIDFLWERVKPSDKNTELTSDKNDAQIGSSGDGAQIGSSGGRARIGSSGDGAQIGSSGGRAQIGSSGDWAQIGSSGDGAQIGSSGDWARIGSSGDGAQIGSSGDWARITMEGTHSVAATVGHGGKIKGKIGCWITLAEWEQGNDGKWIPFCVKSAQIDGQALKEDTWYELKGGEFSEVTDEE